MKRKTILNYYSKSIISLLLIILLSFSILPPRYTSSESIKLPSGWNFSSSYKNIPVTLNKVTYYAYEIYKVDNNKKTVGWLIVDSNNKVITDKDTYEKLAMAATVTKYSKELNELKNMEEEEKIFNQIKWETDFSKENLNNKLGFTSEIDKIISNKIPIGTLEQSGFSKTSVSQSNVTNLSNNFLAYFSKVATDYMNIALIESGEIAFNLNGYQKDSLVAKVFGLLKISLRKGAYTNFKEGVSEFDKAFNIIQKHNGVWSYEDASAFLSSYEQGEARATSYGKLYLRLTSSSSLNNLWNDTTKKKISDLISKPANFKSSFSTWLSTTVKQDSAGVFGYNEMLNDIKSVLANFALYSFSYDTSIKDSPANLIYSAVNVSNLTQYGTLYITSIPSGAKVYINGSYKGVTPVAKSLAPGNYTIEITKDGYTSYKTSVSVLPNKASQVKATLSAILKKGTLHVISNPIDASIYINGKFIGKTPLYFYEIYEGTYSIQLKKEGYIDYFGEVKIIAGKNTVFSKTLTPKP
jgi:hypothetical protein